MEYFDYYVSYNWIADKNQGGFGSINVTATEIKTRQDLIRIRKDVEDILNEKENLTNSRIVILFYSKLAVMAEDEQIDPSESHSDDQDEKKE